MRKTYKAILFSILTAFSGCGGVSGRGDPDGGAATGALHARPVVAAANSYLEAATADTMADAHTAVEILPLAGPGTCPGHFDLRPSQIERLSQCRLLVRFDFQNHLEEKLSVRVGGRLPVAAVEVRDGMCRPSSYAGGCRQIADALVEAGCLDRAAADARLEKIAARMEALSAWCREQIEAAGLRDMPVVASEHQESFCRGLGLRPVAKYSGSETRPSSIDAAVEAAQGGGAKLLIANLPEGRRVADMLAERLGIATVVFDNFPKSAGPMAFDELVRDNVAKLIAQSSRVGFIPP